MFVTNVCGLRFFTGVARIGASSQDGDGLEVFADQRLYPILMGFFSDK